MLVPQVEYLDYIFEFFSLTIYHTGYIVGVVNNPLVIVKRWIIVVDILNIFLWLKLPVGVYISGSHKKRILMIKRIPSWVYRDLSCNLTSFNSNGIDEVKKSI